jgi:predicted AlkP superfamily pyrophosphatase or phosphodiesterase/Zn-dependent M28 family amino/carboxypeptidase
MRLLMVGTLCLLTACSGGPSVQTSPGAARGGSTVVLVSLDGFRWDYLDRSVAPNLQRLAAGGVRAQWMTAAFPTKTFPNHYTIVTGLHPGNHGIVANNMRDSVLGAFRLSDTLAQRDARWWGGEPIWRTVQRQGKRAAAYYWPGSEAAIGGAHPWRWMPFDDDAPNAPRVDSVLAWLSLPKGQAPSVVTLYYSDVDHAGHSHGPDAPQTDSAIARVDSMIGRLIDGLAARGLRESVNVIVVSDHGMIETPKERLIVLDEYIDLADVDVVDWTPVGAVVPKPGKEAAVYAALAKAHPQLKVYRKGEVPARFHFNTHARITPLVLVAEPGWSITSKSRVAGWRGGASHGWDPEARGMGALFVAAGPAFRQGVAVAPFRNVHLYELMSHIVGVTPAPNDGALDSVRHLLRGTPEQGASADRIRRHLITLASDAYEGRQPGTRGDTLATRYVQRAMESAGLSAGSADGSWFQSVSLLGATPGGTVRRWTDSTTRSTFGAGDLLLSTRGVDGPRRLDAGDAVFVGHGIVTADGRWDDYKGLDVRGKVVVVLGGVPQAATGVSLAPGEQQRTAASRGAWAVATIVHPAQWAQLSPAFRREMVRLAPDTSMVGTLEILVHPDAATRFFGDGTALAAARTEAAQATFRPRALPGKVFVEYLPRRRAVTSPNVLGLLPGSDPILREEVVVVTAHWDHFGRNPALTGDQIFNGAFDNALGTASMLEMARVLANGPRPKRSVLFVATTAEESGLLGATWYTREPRFPLAQTVAAVNLDAGNPWGRTRDVIVLGGALSSLDSIFGAVAATQGRRVSPDPYPEQGFFRRSDHYAFARVGVPAMFTASGMDVVDRPVGWGRAQFDRYLAGTYHSPGDEVGADWDLRGGAEDVDALAETVRRVANGAGRPVWNAGPDAAPYREAAARLGRRP